MKQKTEFGFLEATPRLPVADVRRTADFYREILGFEICVLWPESAPVFCLLQKGGAKIAFDAAPDFPGSKHEAAGFYLATDRALAVCEAVRGRVGIEWGPEVYSYGRREFAFRDPDGYLIVVSEETGDPPTCDIEEE